MDFAFFINNGIGINVKFFYLWLISVLLTRLLMRNLEDVGGSSVMYSSNFRIRETCSSCLKRIEKDIRSLSECLRTVESSWVAIVKATQGE